MEQLLCNKPWTCVVIRGDMGVRNCCWQVGSLGNLRTQSFEEIWNGPEIKEVRLCILNGKMPDKCQCIKALGFVPSAEGNNVSVYNGT